MTHKTMANLLRGVIIFLVLCGIFMHIWWILFGPAIFFMVSIEFLLADICLLPCYAVTIIVWKNANFIAKEQEFCRRNATSFRWMFGLALGDSVLFVAASVILFILERGSLWGILLTVPFAVLGMCVAICSAVMSHLIDRAAGLQEDSDLTI